MDKWETELVNAREYVEKRSENRVRDSVFVGGETIVFGIAIVAMLNLAINAIRYRKLKEEGGVKVKKSVLRKAGELVLLPELPREEPAKPKAPEPQITAKPVVDITTEILELKKEAAEEIAKIIGNEWTEKIFSVFSEQLRSKTFLFELIDGELGRLIRILRDAKKTFSGQMIDGKDVVMVIEQLQNRGMEVEIDIEQPLQEESVREAKKKHPLKSMCPAGFRGTELIRTLAEYGFKTKPTEGGHLFITYGNVIVRDSMNRPVVMPYGNKTIATGTARSILDACAQYLRTLESAT